MAGPQAQAYQALVHQLETLLGMPLEELRRELDGSGGRSLPYARLVERIARDHSVPEAYASLAARIYRPAPGDGQGEGLAAFVRARTR